MFGEKEVIGEEGKILFSFFFFIFFPLFPSSDILVGRLFFLL